MITDQIKRRVSPEVKDHFLDEWGKIVDPSELAGKLDDYESVRSARKQHFPKALERKPAEKIKPVSPKRELKGKPLGNSGPPVLEKFYTKRKIGETKILNAGNQPRVISVIRRNI
ncbi:hypothetical protein AVEN_201616-1 [Araneus ventricosus]|uniref:Uncharacterized protein n=1 Tax=Araneus ventricosus TaxID=182803 RepID=A0A4Y2CMQ5_ARAVE|nr:hypothetical protein AVEN_97054-1 [Araneus ventricosus]GBM05466.1 hypothetical protein AVEN_22849-1 [Araneus ventricosus]GBM05498.1 hypothetical protein AVEN_143979-1 [Araneus ventricosus]GBM05510.1 hypothetical protein AVEN_201616-1 [Araneus ventricosus]